MNSISPYLKISAIDTGPHSDSFIFTYNLKDQSKEGKLWLLKYSREFGFNSQPDDVYIKYAFRSRIETRYGYHPSLVFSVYKMSEATNPIVSAWYKQVVICDEYIETTRLRTIENKCYIRYLDKDNLTFEKAICNIWEHKQILDVDVEDNIKCSLCDNELLWMLQMYCGGQLRKACMLWLHDRAKKWYEVHLELLAHTTH